MTVPATTRRAGPFNGNDSSTSFPFAFRVFSKDDVQVQFANAAGVSSTLVLDSDYSVTVNADQDATPGGSITYPISGDPLAAGEKLVILGAVPYEQTTDLPAGGAYRASVVEDALDRTVMQVQQLSEELGRALTLPATAAGASTELPAPVANNFIGWDEAASALRNVDPSTAASIVAYATWRTEVFNGGASSYTLAADPGSVNNCDVAVGGVVQTPGVDFTVSGTTLTPSPAWPAGTGNVVVRYGQALPQGVSDSATSAFLPAGAGATPRSAQDKLRETISASDYTSLQVAISAAKVLGRPTRILLTGDISTSTTIVVDAPNIIIDGAGSDSAHDVGSQGGGARSRIIWTGLAGGTVMQFASPSGAGLQACAGGGVQNVFFSCGSSAAIGLQVLSWRRGTFRNLHFDNPTLVGLDVGVVATLGEARDPQYNDFRQISSRHFETAGGTGGLLRLDGDATANTSLNYFEQLDCQFVNGTAYLFNNCDNNMVVRCRAFRAGGGTGSAIVFNGSNSAADQAARSNIVVHFTTNGALPIIHRGTSSFTHPSLDNSVTLMDYDNGYQSPTYEAGATGAWSDTRGMQARTALLTTGIGEDISNTISARSRLGSESVHIVNGAQNHLRLSDPANANVWGLNIDSSGNLRLTRVSGSGSVLLGGNVTFNSKAVSEGAVDSGGTGFRVLRVAN